MKKVNILGVKVAMVGVDGAVDAIMDMFGEDRTHAVFTPNSEIVMRAYKDADFCAKLNSADLLTADGIGLVHASKIIGRPISERAAGFDIAMALLPRLAEAGKSLFLFGSKPGVAERAAKILTERNEGLKIAGCRNGYFSPGDVDVIIDEINASGADIVFVCLGAPAQENWICKNRDRLNARVLIGLGGSLDAVCGDMPRAPKWWCDHGLEWFYRLAKQPSRIGRMMSLPQFGLTALIHGRKFKQEDE